MVSFRNEIFFLKEQEFIELNKFENILYKINKTDIAQWTQAEII